MASDAYCEGEPAPEPLRPLPAYPATYDLSSVELPHVPVRERNRLIALFAAPPVLLALGYCLRTGWDLTGPYVVGVGIVALISLGLAGVGFLQRDGLRGVGGFVSLIWSLGFGGFGLEGIFWSGSRDVDFTFIMVDAKTGAGIKGAVISITEFGNTVIARTDERGVASLRFQCMSHGSSSLVCDTGGISFSGISLKVQAAGYADFETNLSAVAGRFIRIHDPPPPPIQMRLAPK